MFNWGKSSRGQEWQKKTSSSKAATGASQQESGQQLAGPANFSSSVSPLAEAEKLWGSRISDTFVHRKQVKPWNISSTRATSHAFCGWKREERLEPGNTDFLLRSQRPALSEGNVCCLSPLQKTGTAHSGKTWAKANKNPEQQLCIKPAPYLQA